MRDDNRFSVRSLLIFTMIVAVFLAQPKLAVTVGLAMGSVFICALLVLAIQDAWRTTETSERRLVVPYSFVLAIFVVSSCFWGVLALGSFLALFF